MSHISVFKTKVRNPNSELLGEALSALAQQINAEVVATAEGYTLTLPDGRYVRVRVRGELELLTDTWGWRTEFLELKDKIVQTYMHFALLRQLAEMGYQVQNVGEREGVIVGEVVRI